MRQCLAATGVGRMLAAGEVVLDVSGVRSLYANIEGRGLVAITGCGHHTLDRIDDFARDHFVDGDRPHGLYGELHLEPFSELSPRQEDVVRNMGN
jgi:7,8-dihydropterin-6-yl-methyl-4-(beta-D-ribofuranosyl)aminobenzene 5'-phosphate synthase